MKFPKVIRHRKAECKIYGKKPGYPFYRVAWYVTGQRRVKQFATYSKAKEFADALVKELAKGSQTTALTPTQATDALAAVDRLKAYHQQTGRNVSLLRVVSEWVEASRGLNGRPLAEAVEGFMANVVTVKRIDLAKGCRGIHSNRRTTHKVCQWPASATVFRIYSHPGATIAPFRQGAARPCRLRFDQATLGRLH